MNLADDCRRLPATIEDTFGVPDGGELPGSRAGIRIRSPIPKSGWTMRSGYTNPSSPARGRGVSWRRR